jgi:hypothetical protein
MQMTSPFQRPIRTQEEIVAHESHRITEAVIRKLENIPEPSVPPYVGHTTASLARHYTTVIKIKNDLGWGSSKALNDMKHHARQATITAKGFADTWKFNTAKGGVGGWNNLSSHAAKMIKGLRTRVYPSLAVSDAEFDPQKLLRKRHFEIENAHACSASRKKIREMERRELQIVLNSMAKAIGEWEMELLNASKDAGFK